MPILTVENVHSLKKHEFQENLTQKVFIADSSFVLDKYLERDKALKLWQEAVELNTLFFVNVTIRNELMDNIFKFILGEIIYELFTKKNLEWFLNIDERVRSSERFSISERWVKHLRKNNKELLDLAITRTEEVLSETLSDFPYLSTSNPMLSSSASLNWVQVEDLIKKYYLGSSDAMIANFVLNYPQIDGLVTSDSDFLEIQEFENSEKLLIYIQKRS
jgi:predicted nucleic acid-binding protein